MIVDESVPARKEALKDTLQTLDTSILNAMINKFNINEYKAVFTKIEGAIYLDLISEKSNELSGFHIQHFFSGHSISKIRIYEDTLWFSTLKDDWLSEISLDERKKIGLMENEKGKILTASTDELRVMVKTITNNFDAFGEESYFVKIK